MVLVVIPTFNFRKQTDRSRKEHSSLTQPLPVRSLAHSTRHAAGKRAHPWMVSRQGCRSFLFDPFFYAAARRKHDAPASGSCRQPLAGASCLLHGTITLLSTGVTQSRSRTELPSAERRANSRTLTYFIRFSSWSSTVRFAAGKSSRASSSSVTQRNGATGLAFCSSPGPRPHLQKCSSTSPCAYE